MVPYTVKTNVKEITHIVFKVTHYGVKKGPLYCVDFYTDNVSIYTQNLKN